ELSQEVFVRLLERVGRYGIPDDIVGYAVKAGFAVATDHVRRKIRKARKQEWLVGDFHDEVSSAYESNVENDIFLHELLCAAARTETERLTFVYRYLLGYTLAELAALQRRGCRTYERATASIVARARRIV
ncbi:MAG: hypothetical protein GTO41_08545, partial [Burkholderiales bacterium]|nr:hypothetical protein [Burkholderiales bacterium]